MYSNELRNKLWLKKLYIENFYDSPLNGFNSLNVNSCCYYVILRNNKHKIDDYKSILDLLQGLLMVKVVFHVVF